MAMFTKVSLSEQLPQQKAAIILMVVVEKVVVAVGRYILAMVRLGGWSAPTLCRGRVTISVAVAAVTEEMAVTDTLIWMMAMRMNTIEDVWSGIARKERPDEGHEMVVAM